LNLAKGATVIDAAFQIHTEVGLTMHGVEINGKPVSFSYELRNGDVVSVLTGKGKPATDWMRFAKIRSTRSKLRSYFRRKQRESLRDAGAILVFDFLSMYGELIKESSYLEECFEVPTTPEGIAQFLPGKTQYTDVDDLLTDIGNSHDRDFLRAAVAKLFLVPQKTLVSAEEDRREYLSNPVLTAVNEKRQNAFDVGAALADEGDDYVLDEVDSRTRIGLPRDNSNFPRPSLGIGVQGVNGNVNGDIKPLQVDGNAEIADPEFLCKSCLPIFGDEIIGTRPMGKVDGRVTVHRCGCPISQTAINQSQATASSKRDASDNYSLRRWSPKKNGASNKARPPVTTRIKARLNGSDQTRSNDQNLELVKLKWDESYIEKEDILYLTELSVVAEDRKYLLADCGELVSDMSEIVKTGSLSTEEHAIFEFLVKIKSLDHLQKLMDSLMEIRSVISAERKFGSSS